MGPLRVGVWLVTKLVPARERSPLYRPFLWALVVGAGTAVVVCLVVVVATLVRQRPVAGLTVLLIPGVPLLIVGQVWAVVSMIARQGGWGRGSRQWRSFLDPLGLFFGDLRRDVVTGVLVLAFGGWLAAMTASSPLARGGPDGGDAACPYRLAQHGAHVCASKAEYDQAGAAEQRFAAGILLSFFSLHAGVALGDVLGGSSGREAHDHRPSRQ